MRKAIFAEIVVAGVIGLGLASYFLIEPPKQPLQTNTASSTVTVAHCDNDAKLCPDGSTVLREGESCEFAACPSMFGEVRDWQNRKDPKSDIAFKYPTTLGSTYVTASKWPPTVTNKGKDFKCQLDEATTTKSGYSSTEEIYNDATYCVWQKSEGAAGSTFTEYEVIGLKDDTYLSFYLSVQTPQCMNYESGEQSICQAAQGDFSVVELVAGMMTTVVW